MTSFALRGLTINKLRTGLTTLGIMIGVMSVIILIAVGNGSAKAVQSSLDRLGTNSIQIRSSGGGFGGARARAATTNIKPLTTADANALVDPVQAPDIKQVAPMVTSNSTCVNGSSTSTPSTFVGTTPAYFEASNTPIAKGSYFTADDVTQGRRFAIIGNTTATELFGTDDPLNQTIRCGGIQFTVIGVSATKGSSGFQDGDSLFIAPITALQSSLTGYGSLSTILCNATGVHDDSTAELAVGLAIASRRGIPDFVRDQDRATWNHKRYPSFSDSKIAIVGYGSIGQNVARNLSGFTVDVTGFSRSGRDGSLTMDKLDALLPTFDIVILVLPLNAESKHLFDARRLSLLKDGALIVNVARGGIIDTDALVAELNSGRIHAALDVTDPEPLPSEHPLWKAKNVLIAPHVGGDSTAFESRGKTLVEEQIARLAKGDPLKNIVAVGKA